MNSDQFIFGVKLSQVCWKTFNDFVLSINKE